MKRIKHILASCRYFLNAAVVTHRLDSSCLVFGSIVNLFREIERIIVSPKTSDKSAMTWKTYHFDELELAVT